MLKEIRDLALYVFGFLDDVSVLMQNSTLSMSPTMRLGRDRAVAIQLSGILSVVLISILIRTLKAQQPNIDLLAFSAACVAYFAIMSFIVSKLVERFIQDGDQNYLQPKPKARDLKIDSYSYVLFFNMIALAVFALLRVLATVIGFHLSSLTIVLINVVAAGAAAVVASALILFLNARSKDPENPLTFRQKSIIASMMTLTFVIYVTVIAPY
jgi:hypothetical protein